MSDIALVGPAFRRSGRSPAPSQGHPPVDALSSRADGGASVPPPEVGSPSETSLRRWRTQLVSEVRAAAAESGPTPIRWQRVRDVRAAIDQGNYLTNDRLDAAVDGLLRDLEP